MAGKILKVVAGLLLAGVAAGLVILFLVFPKVGPATDLKVDATPVRVARGKYLVENWLACLECHSKRDWSRYGGPSVPGTEGMGGERYGPESGFPGTLHAPNITPAALSSWTDGEIARAITAGLSRDGTPLFPLMPYPSYRSLTEEDLAAVIAYLRSIKSTTNSVPPRQLSFPMNIFVRMIPQPYAPVAAVDEKDKVAYGRYLATVSGCVECHTIRDHGKPRPGMEFAGGHEFPFPGGVVVRSANITSDKETGIGAWTEEAFIARFKAFEGEAGRSRVLAQGQPNTVMPWLVYAGLTHEDLGALHAFLKTVPPVKHAVPK